MKITRRGETEREFEFITLRALGWAIGLLGYWAIGLFNWVIGPTRTLVRTEYQPTGLLGFEPGDSPKLR